MWRRTRPLRGATLNDAAFAGLKLSAGANHTSGSAAQGVGQDIPDRPEPDGLAERIRPLSGFEQAVDRYAQAFSAAEAGRARLATS